MSRGYRSTDSTMQTLIEVIGSQSTFSPPDSICAKIRSSATGACSSLVAGVVGAEFSKFSTDECTEACLYSSKKICSDLDPSMGALAIDSEYLFALPSAGGSYCIALFDLHSNQDIGNDGWGDIRSCRVLGLSSPFSVQVPMILTTNSTCDTTPLGCYRDRCSALVEDLKNLSCLSVSLSSTSTSADPALENVANYINHVSVQLTRTPGEVGSCALWEVAVHYKVYPGPGEVFSSSVSLLIPTCSFDLSGMMSTRVAETGQQTTGGVAISTVDSAAGKILIRLPYHRVRGTCTSHTPPGVTLEEMLNSFTASRLDDCNEKEIDRAYHISCKLCSIPIVDDMISTKQFPSGRFDENFDEFMCCEHPIGPMSSLDLQPSQGTLRLNSDVVSIHPGDLNPRNVSSDASVASGPLSSIHCSTCSNLLGEAMSTLERLEEWMNNEKEEGAVESMTTAIRATVDSIKLNANYDANILSDVRLYVHKVKVWSTGRSNLELLVDYEQILSCAIVKEMKSHGTSTVHLKRDPGYSLKRTKTDGPASAEPVLVVRVLSSGVGLQHFPDLHRPAATAGSRCHSPSPLTNIVQQRAVLKVFYKEVSGAPATGAGGEQSVVAVRDEDFAKLRLLLLERHTHLQSVSGGPYRTFASPWAASYLFQ